MNINNYKYVRMTEMTGDIVVDATQFLLENNKEETLKHLIEVSNTSRSIAKQYKLDENICMISAFLHDISVVIHPNDMLAYMLENNLFIDESEVKFPFILHQRISMLLAKNFFKIEDDSILSAIECHTTLKQNPSQYDMALFIADKLSWDQKGIPPFYDVVVKSLDFSLEKACLTYINYIIDNGMVLYPHSWLVESKQYLENVLNIT